MGRILFFGGHAASHTHPPTVIDDGHIAEPAANRKGIGRKLRFEVFKRDKFTCQYCGKVAPDVVLVVDHVTPVAKGGANELLNLITACVDCNSGKSDRMLSDDSAVAKQRVQLELLAERREQIDMMLEWSRELGNQREYEVDAFIGRCNEHFANFSTNDSGRADVKRWLRKYNMAELLDALDTAATQYLKPDSKGKLEAEDVERAFRTIPAIARTKKLPAVEQEMLYVRGIVRNRLSYCNERHALQLIREAVEAGIGMEHLKQVARGARTWTGWQDDMIALLPPLPPEGES